ncbi:hypothetical protein [Streptomyces europaeiscabiei]|uniref:hypothetical protein n=1 Tax=Streptomyces europaeiscabiei TaxID=146819 RepID=UPI002E14B9F6|nr:hypothetical protein OHB30_03420 [Streptomyces europaeiscabiei]
MADGVAVLCAGGNPVTLAGDTGRAAELGTTELGLYQGRLASDQDDLTAVREASTAVG